VIVDKYGRVAGSIDLATLAQMYVECDDDDLKAHYREVAAENGTDLEATETSTRQNVDFSSPQIVDAIVNDLVELGGQAPPRAGKGSGRDEWVAYAESVGVEVTDDMTRDEIIAAVEE
jgi:hypothetical protein